MNQPYKKQVISGWGNYPVADCKVFRPEKLPDLNLDIQENNSLIGRGSGLSYGDASLNTEGVILSERLDKFLGFDEQEGIITVQAGVTLAEIMDVAIPKGWILPVIPGTKHVSAGGAFASNIHGKNHYVEGDFANHVKEIKLILSSGAEVSCSATENTEIFWASAGGMGLTGIIKEVSIKLKPIKSLSLLTQSKKTDNIYEMVECFKEAKNDADYMIGWIDHFAKDNELGRGVFEKANHINVENGGKPVEEYKPSTKSITIPKFFPSFILNKYSMAFYNKLRFGRYSQNWKEEVVNFDGFFHPLDGLNCWNRLYGSKGFFQYQFIIPETEDVADRLNELLSFIHKSGQFSFLAVLKYHGDHNGLLSFPIRGYSLALDFPNTKQVRDLQKELNKKIASLGGRIYLAKDALLTKELFFDMYKNELSQWQRIVHSLDADNKFTSIMAQRLDMKGIKHG